jgi:hypothetical protein
MTKLSDSQHVILSAAAQHEMGLARAPKNLPAAARNAVFNSLIKNNLLTEINAPQQHVGLGWRQDVDGTWIVARITDDGLRAIGIDPNESAAAANGAVTEATVAAAGYPKAAVSNAVHAPPNARETVLREEVAVGLITTQRTSLRITATALLEAWDACPAQDATDNRISRCIEALRTCLTSKPGRAPRDPGAPRKPREGTKQERVLAMLRRSEGATVAQIAEATAWADHTVRGFFAGLKKKGHSIEVLERVRQVGPNRQGSKGSYSVYRIAVQG